MSSAAPRFIRLQGGAVYDVSQIAFAGQVQPAGSLAPNMLQPWYLIVLRCGTESTRSGAEEPLRREQDLIAKLLLGTLTIEEWNIQYWGQSPTVGGE